MIRSRRLTHISYLTVNIRLHSPLNSSSFRSTTLSHSLKAGPATVKSDHLAAREFSLKASQECSFSAFSLIVQSSISDPCQVFSDFCNTPSLFSQLLILFISLSLTFHSLRLSEWIRTSKNQRSDLEHCYVLLTSCHAERGRDKSKGRDS